MLKKTSNIVIIAFFAIIISISFESNAGDVFYGGAAERPSQFNPKPPIEKKFFALQDKYVEGAEPEIVDDDKCNRSKMSGNFDHGVNFNGIK